MSPSAAPHPKPPRIKKASCRQHGRAARAGQGEVPSAMMPVESPVFTGISACVPHNFLIHPIACGRSSRRQGGLIARRRGML